jgi:hypothetical protein
VSPGRRGQFVLAAAVVVAVALVPMLTAYLQLGYPADAAAERADTPRLADARAALDRAVARSAAAVADRPPADGTAAAERVVTALDRTTEALSAGGAPADRTYLVAGNATVAADLARTDCPTGERRRFGGCRAVGGVVVQERLGRPTVVAAAVDLRIEGPDERTRVTLVLRPDGDGPEPPAPTG